MSAMLNAIVAKIEELCRVVSDISRVLHNHEEAFDNIERHFTESDKYIDIALQLIARTARSSSDPTLVTDLEAILERARSNTTSEPEERHPELLN